MFCLLIYFKFLIELFLQTTGEVCAVKLFHDRVSQHYSAVPHREIELLQRLKHRNVISIFDIQREVRKNPLIPHPTSGKKLKH